MESLALRDQIKKISRTLEEPQLLLAERLQAAENLESAKPAVVERVDYSQWALWERPELAQYGILTQKQTDSVDCLTWRENEWLMPQTFDEEFPHVALTSERELATDSQSLPDRLRNLRTDYLPQNKQRLWSQAFSGTQPVIVVKPFSRAEEPLILRQEVSGPTVQKLTIIVGEGAEFALVHQLESVAGAAGSVHLEIDILAEPGSHVTYTGISRLNEKQPAYILRNGFGERDSTLDWRVLTLGDGSVVEDTQGHLIETGASMNFHAATVTRGRQTVAVNTQMENYAAHTVSDIHQKGITTDESTLTFNGIGHISNGAKQSDAQQESRILMLSEQARGDANPILLIDEYEVTAGHAASIGRMDEEIRYYLMSRGLTQERAEQLYALGFVKSAVASSGVEAIDQESARSLEARLHD